MKNWKLPPAPDRAVQTSDGRICLLGRQVDFECVLLASMGLSDKAITRQTGLTPGQIQYRLRAAKAALVAGRLTRKLYRRGTSPLAAQVVAVASEQAARSVTAGLRIHL